MRTLLNLVRLPPSTSVISYLRLEEALLRAGSGNWLLVLEHGVAPPSLVLGVSNKIDEWVTGGEEAVKRGGMGAYRGVQGLVRRYSGGGAVVVDENTILVGMIVEREAMEERGVAMFPRPVMAWTEKVYREAIGAAGANNEVVEEFRLRENDYVFADRKFGGNAQSFSSGRCVHHSSFLWDFCPRRMESLTIPKRQPDYRSFRNHDDFLCKLSDVLESRASFVDGLLKSAEGEGFRVEEEALATVEAIRDTRKHQQTTQVIM